MRRAERRWKRRSPVARWTRRIAGAVATAAVLVVGVVIGSMVLEALDDDDAAVGAAPRAAAESGKRDAAGLNRLQRRDRRAAVAVLRDEGYAPVKLADYRADHILRVLIGKPAGDTAPGLRAFFFVDGEYLGTDAATPSGKLRPGRQLEREITLVYTLYEDGDERCCPRGGDTRVHFRWTGDKLKPREPIPPAAERLPPA